MINQKSFKKASKSWNLRRKSGICTRNIQNVRAAAGNIKQNLVYEKSDYRSVTIKPPPLKLKSAKCFLWGLISDQKISKCLKVGLISDQNLEKLKIPFFARFPIGFPQIALKIPIFFRSALRAQLKLDKTIIFVFLFALISSSSCYNTNCDKIRWVYLFL